jgi:ABC-type phosphate transport system substrate-binding protein
MKAFISAVCATLLLAAPAFAEVVVVVNPAADAVTKDQIAAVYLGKSTAFTPIDQTDGSAIRGEFYKKVADKDAAQAKALWSKLVFTGKASPPKEVASSADVKKAIAANPKAIGYIEKSAVDASVKVVLTP